jgi:hypothetical protein
MGRSGIKRRKLRSRLPAAEDSGILADLEDQAEWSSYGQGIPRLGNPRRDAIWWQRGWRSFRNLGRMRRNPQIQDRGFWPAILVGSILVGVFIASAILVLLIVGRLLTR